MSATDGANSPEPWDSETVEPVLPGLLRGTQNELSDDVFEQILAAIMEPDSNLVDESLIPTDDDPELTENGHFVNPGGAELFLDTTADTESDDEEEAEMEAEDNDNDHRDASNDGDDNDRDFDLDGLYSGDDNSDDDFGGVLS